jgi:nicastrin
MPREQVQLKKVFQDTMLTSDDVSVTLAFPDPSPTKGIPPSPAAAFLKRSATLPVAVLADHEAEFVNQDYHSHTDTVATTNETLLCETATVVARALYSLATGSQAANTSLAADCAFVSELVGCLTRNFKCPVVQRYLGVLTPSDGSDTIRITGYTGVFGYTDKSVTVHAFSYFLRLLLLDKAAI